MLLSEGSADTLRELALVWAPLSAGGLDFFSEAGVRECRYGQRR